MDQKYERLVQWLRSDPRTFISDKIQAKRSYGSGNALFCNAEVQKNEKIISVPSQFNLNFVTILKSLQRYNSSPESFTIFNTPTEPLEVEDTVTELYSLFSYEELTSLSSSQLITMYLELESHREDSFWKPFLDVLPGIEDFSSCPYIWLVEGDDVHFGMLPETVSKHSRVQYATLSADFERVNDLILRKGSQFANLVSFESFVRFWACCNSRCLYMALPVQLQKTNADNMTMVPYVDFLNHHIEDHSFTRVQPNGFEVISGRRYQSGDQVFFSYGPHSDEFLLCEYGFMFDRGINKWNSVDISSKILSRLASCPNKQKFLLDAGYWGDYTIGSDVSFRTEVVLAALQEEEADFGTSAPRRLVNFISGLSSGELYKPKTKKYLKELASEFASEFEPFLQLQNDSRSYVIQRLYENIIDVASSCTESL